MSSFLWDLASDSDSGPESLEKKRDTHIFPSMSELIPLVGGTVPLYTNDDVFHPSFLTFIEVP